MNTAELRLHIDAYLNLRGSLGWQTEITGYYLRELSNYVEARGFSWPIAHRRSWNGSVPLRLTAVCLDRERA